jgi:CHAD domain-containing protein
MLKKKKQQRFLDKKNREWGNELRTFDSSREDEALHRLRLAVKKIKAFARLSAACSGDHAAKDIHLLKKMFKQAGTIRDAGNHLQLLEHFHGAPESYKTEQDQLKATASAQFVHDIGEYRRLGKAAARRMSADIHSIRTGCIKDWYAAQLVKIGVLLTASGDRLHKARKLIKELLYVLKVLPSGLANELGLDVEYLDKLQDAIGKWHDVALVAGAWAGKDLIGSQAMVRECREKLAEVRTLAGDYYMRAHRM